MRDIRSDELTPQQAQLVELARRIGFGRIYGIPVVDGEPQISPNIRVHRTMVLGKGRDSSPKHPPSDFALKRGVVDLLRLIKASRTMIIHELVIVDGVPVNVTIEETAEELISA